MTTPAGVVEDNVPEDMALVIDTDQGLVVLTGCGHAGVVNTIDYARTVIRPERVHALIGGLHLFAAKAETLAWTAEKLRGFGVEHLIGAHCTGIESVFRLRADLGLDREHAVVGGELRGRVAQRAAECAPRWEECGVGRAAAGATEFRVAQGRG